MAGKISREGSRCETERKVGKSSSSTISIIRCEIYLADKIRRIYHEFCC